MSATVSYSYLGLNAIVRVDAEEPEVRWNLISGSGANPYAGLDRFGRVIDCQWQMYSGTPTDLARLKYDYNPDSSRLWREDAVASSGFDELYAYDELQRLFDMKRGNLNVNHNAITGATLGQNWTLDTTGNWKGFSQSVTGAITQTRASNRDNEITSITNSVGGAWQTPIYNDGGAMLGMPNAGSAVTPARIAQYDAWGRLASITSGFTLAATFVYDGLNRRVLKNTQSGSTITQARHYYYSNQWQVLEERVGTASTAERQYVWGLRYVDDLVLRDRDTNGDGTLDERLYAMQDANWNVVAICDTSRDTNTAVKERYAYTPYGMVSFLNASFGSLSSSSFSWNYLFTGRERDTESALQLNRNRYYHPRLGCWISRDPIGFKGGQLSLNAYVGNAPTGLLDPNGLWRYVGGMGILDVRLGAASDGWNAEFGLGFKPNAAAFQSGANGTCCSEVGFVQVAIIKLNQSTYGMGISFGVLPWNPPLNKWFNDTTSASAPYYPPDTTNNDPRKGILPYPSMSDAPGINSGRFQVLDVSYSFETCVVCSKGTGSGGKTGAGDVFGCLQWGYYFQTGGTPFNRHVVSQEAYVNYLKWTNDATMDVVTVDADGSHTSTIGGSKFAPYHSYVAPNAPAEPAMLNILGQYFP